MAPLLCAATTSKITDYIILHIGTSDALNNTLTEILHTIFKLKTCIQKELWRSKIAISTPIKRRDHGKASLTLLHLSKEFKYLSILLLATPILELFI